MTVKAITKWHRLPQPPDVNSTTTGESFIKTLDVDSQGNSYCLSTLRPGVYADGQYTVNTSGTHVSKYDTNGAFIGGTLLDMQATPGAYSFKKKLNHNSGNIYIAGTFLIDEFDNGTVAFGGELITHSKYIAAFDSTGTLLWKKENEGTLAWGGSYYGYDVDVDSENNIYFSGMIHLQIVAVAVISLSLNSAVPIAIFSQPQKQPSTI